MKHDKFCSVVKPFSLIGFMLFHEPDTGLPGYCDSVGTRQKCHNNQLSHYPTSPFTSFKTVTITGVTISEKPCIAIYEQICTECVNSLMARFAIKFLCKFLVQFSSSLAAQQL